jgi:hypothetical protein
MPEPLFRSPTVKRFASSKDELSSLLAGATTSFAAPEYPVSIQYGRGDVQ